ncbi:MAG: SAM-dependent methyltransferase [Chitinophagales bacterium]
MENIRYEIEAEKPFSQSLIWQLNRDYYNKVGINAWRKGTVPHHLTSNSMVGKTYAELIFGFLKDLAYKGQTKEKVYIIELGTGHGRLSFHILKHLGRLIGQTSLVLPPYCYVLSDIVEENLDFFDTHPQFQPYYEQGLLDLTYFDAVEGKKLMLRRSGREISPQDLKQPLLVIANYFFDSIPSDLFYFKDKKISACSIALEATENPEGMKKASTLLKKMELVFTKYPLEEPFYTEAILNEILEEYRDLVFNTYLFFPHKGLQCVHNLRQLSQKGLILISMDKGDHEIHDLENEKKPEMITHGSMSFSVNYHAFAAYCKKQGGKALFPSFSTFELELGCLFFLPETETYTETQAAYQRVVDDYGPDDFHGHKKFMYKHIKNINLPELIGMLRLAAYDSTLFRNVLPRLKKLSTQLTFNERTRLAQTMRQTWDMYFTGIEPDDLAFEIAGIFYQLGFYEDALTYFEYSVELFGYTADGYYNKALCYYQLRKDMLFKRTVLEAKLHFAEENFDFLDNLDLKAV